MGDVKSFKMFIGGEWTDASDGNKREIVSLAHGEVIAEVLEGTAADVDRAVKAAKMAYEETWSDATPGERSRRSSRWPTSSRSTATRSASSSPRTSARCTRSR